jgi:hypothetical protein
VGRWGSLVACKAKAELSAALRASLSTSACSARGMGGQREECGVAWCSCGSCWPTAGVHTDVRSTHGGHGPTR